MKTILARSGGSARIFDVDDAMTPDGALDAFAAARRACRASDPSAKPLEIPADILKAHGLVPAPIAFEIAVPDESALAEMMREDGVAFAGCAQCSHNESGLCARYGGEASDDDANCDHCASENLIQALDPGDPDTVLEYFVLLDPDLLDDPEELLSRLGKYFPALRNAKAARFVRHPSYA